MTVASTGERLWPVEGDSVMAPRGKGFLLSARDTRPGRPAETVHAAPSHGETAVLGDGGEFFMTGARFLLSGPAAGMLLATLSDVIVLVAAARSRPLGHCPDRRRPSPAR